MTSSKPQPRWQFALIAILIAIGASLPFALSGPADAGNDLDPTAITTGHSPEPNATLQAPSTVSEPMIDDGIGELPQVPGGRATSGSGIVRGSVSFDKGISDALSVYQVEFVEGVNPNLPQAATKPRRTVKGFELAPGQTQASFVTTMPFSVYGWRVRAWSPGLNGSEQFIALNEKSPEAMVSLRFRKPITVTIRLMDQLKVGLANVHVLLRPKGRPRGRGIKEGKTNPFGHVHLENVLAGVYDVIIGPVDAPLTETKRIEVPDIGHAFEQIEVPRGGDVMFLVSARGGWPLANVNIEIMTRDATVFRSYKAKTDRHGRANFEHLPEGSYHVHFSIKGYERGYRQIDVKIGDKQQHTVALKRL